MTRYLVWQSLNPTAKPPCCEGVGGPGFPGGGAGGRVRVRPGEFADFEANQHQCVLKMRRIEPLAAPPGGAPVRRLSGPVGDVHRHHPLTVSHQTFDQFLFSSYIIAPFHSSPSLLLVASSSLGLNPTVYQVSSEGGWWRARNEDSPPLRGVPWATPWLKVRPAEKLPTGYISTRKDLCLKD
ncbi:hypothetical protein CEXT_750151 [Caerostris extrusa]|uniref:Uncharacterized protein n=1 Tax=Caerostris extrusa TaxID=172846 RepID=A0AAV4NU73_CAEEX|nr:hypothetical protein CEXT_750151 [Caerostris extrusa]